MNALPTIPRRPATKIFSDFFNCTVVFSQKFPARQDARRPFTAMAVTGCLVQLIPWLLDEDQQLRGVPFSEVILTRPVKKSAAV